MFFGVKERLAIECNIDHRAGSPEFLRGDLWLWAGGLRLGEIPSAVSLSFLAGTLCDSLLFRGQRREDALAGRSGKQVLDIIQEATSGDPEDRTAEQILADATHYGKFLVCGNTEGFDNVLAVLIEDDAGARFIWRSRAWTVQARKNAPMPLDDAVHEVVLVLGEYEQVVASFLDWLEAETGHRPVERDWVELCEEERAELRRTVIARKPSLARPEKRSLLEQAARAELAKRRAEGRAAKVELGPSSSGSRAG